VQVDSTFDSLVTRQGITTEESEARPCIGWNQTGGEEETSPYKSPHIEEMRL
jgi:hypothetical protein